MIIVFDFVYCLIYYLGVCCSPPVACGVNVVGGARVDVVVSVCVDVIVFNCRAVPERIVVSPRVSDRHPVKIFSNRVVLNNEIARLKMYAHSSATRNDVIGYTRCQWLLCPFRTRNL